jgi:hypothetical protein
MELMVAMCRNTCMYIFNAIVWSNIILTELNDTDKDWFDVKLLIAQNPLNDINQLLDDDFYLK